MTFLLPAVRVQCMVQNQDDSSCSHAWQTPPQQSSKPDIFMKDWLKFKEEKSILCVCSPFIKALSPLSHLYSNTSVPRVPLVPNYMKSVSWCRLRRAHNWFGETLAGWEFGNGMEGGGGGQFTSNLGPGWTRIAPHKEEGFQVSKRDLGEKGN